MRKYQGKYPTRICTISGTFAPGISLVETNEGGKYFIRAKDTAGAMPRLNADVYDYKFQRAHVQYFRQDVTRFFRCVDDYEIEFFNAVPSAHGKEDPQEITDLELSVRRAFIKLMAQQNTLVRFK